MYISNFHFSETLFFKSLVENPEMVFILENTSAFHTVDIIQQLYEQRWSAVFGKAGNIQTLYEHYYPLSRVNVPAAFNVIQECVERYPFESDNLNDYLDNLNNSWLSSNIYIENSYIPLNRQSVDKDLLDELVQNKDIIGSILPQWENLKSKWYLKYPNLLSYISILSSVVMAIYEIADSRFLQYVPYFELDFPVMKLDEQNKYEYFALSQKCFDEIHEQATNDFVFIESICQKNMLDNNWIKDLMETTDGGFLITDIAGMIPNMSQQFSSGLSIIDLKPDVLWKIKEDNRNTVSVKGLLKNCPANQMKILLIFMQILILWYQINMTPEEHQALLEKYPDEQSLENNYEQSDFYHDDGREKTIDEIIAGRLKKQENNRNILFGENRDNEVVTAFLNLGDNLIWDKNNYNYQQIIV